MSSRAGLVKLILDSAAAAEDLEDDIEMSEDDMGRPAAPVASVTRKVSSTTSRSLQRNGVEMISAALCTFALL